MAKGIRPKVKAREGRASGRERVNILATSAIRFASNFKFCGMPVCCSTSSAAFGVCRDYLRLKSLASIALAIMNVCGGNLASSIFLNASCSVADIWSTCFGFSATAFCHAASPRMCWLVLPAYFYFQHLFGFSVVPRPATAGQTSNQSCSKLNHRYNARINVVWNKSKLLDNVSTEIH